MKLVVQIPCYNERDTLGVVLDSIPRVIDGIDEIDILVIDDGSTDGTSDVARAHGVQHIVRHTRNMGLARSFRDGVDYALANGADIVVNTDGDNQYPQDRIGDLVAPVVAGTADIVIGDRQTAEIEHFSAFKKRMQWFGSRVVSAAARTRLPDAASGFRAYSRASLMRINVVTQFSYCVETIIQAGNRRMRIESLPIRTNLVTRPSRLFRNSWHHMFKSAAAIIRSYLMFRPYLVLATLGTVLGVLGLIPITRFGVLWILDEDSGHIQSLVLGSSLWVASLLCFALVVLADLQRTNRLLIEESLERVKYLQYPPAAMPSPTRDSVDLASPSPVPADQQSVRSDDPLAPRRTSQRRSPMDGSNPAEPTYGHRSPSIVDPRTASLTR